MSEKKIWFVNEGKIFFVRVFDDEDIFNGDNLLFYRKGIEVVDGMAHFPVTLGIPEKYCPREWEEFISFLWSLARGPVYEGANKRSENVLIPSKVPECPICQRPFRLYQFYYCPDCFIVARAPLCFDVNKPFFRDFRNSEPNMEWLFTEEFELYSRPIRPGDETWENILVSEKILYETVLKRKGGRNGKNS